VAFHHEQGPDYRRSREKRRASASMRCASMSARASWRRRPALPAAGGLTARSNCANSRPSPRARAVRIPLLEIGRYLSLAKAGRRDLAPRRTPHHQPSTAEGNRADRRPAGDARHPRSQTVPRGRDRQGHPSGVRPACRSSREANDEKSGFIGLGLMGSAMASKPAQGPVTRSTVWNPRARPRLRFCARARRQGGEHARSKAATDEMLLSALGSDHAVARGDPRGPGVLDAMKRGSVHVNHATISVSFDQGAGLGACQNTASIMSPRRCSVVPT